MKNLLTAFIFSLALAMGAQNRNSGLSDFVVTPEFMLGISAEANDFFRNGTYKNNLLLGLPESTITTPKNGPIGSMPQKRGSILGIPI